MNRNDIWEALIADALYTYEWDVTAGGIPEEIDGRDGVKYRVNGLSREGVSEFWRNGKKKLELNWYEADCDRYIRLTCYLSENPEDGHVHAYLIGEDISELEEGKGRTAELDNRNLKRERQTLTEERDSLTRERNDLTEERDTLTRQKNDLTEERDTLTREKHDLTEERDSLTRERNDLTEERDTLTREKQDLTEERDNLTRERNDLTEERDNLTRERNDLTEERDNLTREKHDLTEERDNLTREKRDLTEERDNLTREKNDLTEERDNLTREKNDLTVERDSLTVENIELNQAVDAVHSILRSGSYLCTYTDGASLQSVKYSDALRKLYGYSDETDFPDVWESWLHCIVPEDREYVESSYQEALDDVTGETAYDVTYRSRRKDGVVRWQRTAGYVLRRADGTPITCYGLVMDVDEQKKASDKIEQALIQAQIANAAKTSFLARMSHDIRTPMNGILGLLEINERHAGEVAFTSKNRKKMKVAANYLLSLINDVLQLSKLEDPDVKLSYEAFDVKELAEDILTIIKMRAEDHGITLEYNEKLDKLQHRYVWGSPLHVRQICINILSNAIKYNKKNGKIWCEAECEELADNQVLYRVIIADNGIGMSEEFQKHLFEPFAREHEGISSTYEGTGLGMAIVKQLIEKMGGSIEVESKEHEGSRFTVTLPFQIAGKEDIENGDTETDVDISGTEVLLVEDNELNMEIAETLLTDAGAKVTKAFNGQQAVHMFNGNPEGRFDIILMDVMMPILNGYEATMKIRALDRPDAKTIPIIAMTANAFAEDIEESRAAGMNEHISKPLDIQKVIAAIGKYRRK